MENKGFKLINRPKFYISQVSQLDYVNSRSKLSLEFITEEKLMLKKSTYYLMLIVSLLLLPFSMQSIAADKNPTLSPPVQTIAKININKATDKQLATIKGIGTKKAKAIVDYRKMNGKFSTVEELMKVKGIGENTVKKIKPFISL